MRRWLEHYISNGSNELSQEQGQRQSREYNHNPDWQSHKYDLSDWRSAQQIYLPELGMKLGPATNKMKKLWRLWHKAQREGTPKRDHAYNIAKIQYAIGLINPTQFDELQNMDLDLEFGGQQMEEDEWTQGLRAMFTER